MAKLSTFQAVRMGSEYFQLMRAAAAESRPFVAKDFRARAETNKAVLLMHGWRILPDGINVERIK
jgi:hypothetical protein